MASEVAIREEARHEGALAAASRWRGKLEKVEHRLAKLRDNYKNAGADLQRTGTRMAGAGVVGAWEARVGASAMPTVFGIDHRLTIGAGAYFGARTFLGGRNRELVEDLGEGVLCAWAYDAGRNIANTANRNAGVVP